MKFFSRSEPSELTPVEAAEVAVSKAQERRDRLQIQIADALGELTQRKAGAAQAALDHGADIDKYGADIAARTATHEALSTALDSAGAEVFKAEQELAAARDAADRAVSINELEGLIAAIQVASGPFGAALDSLIAPLNRASEISLDCKAIGGLFDTATAALSHRAKEIAGGTGRATLPRPAPAPVAIAPAPTTPMLALYDVRWTDHAGTVRYCARGWDAPLPVSIAQRALVVGLVVAADSPEAIKARRDRGSVNADPERAVDLDQTNPTPPPPPPERMIAPFRPTWTMPGAGPQNWFGKPT